jgi:hypothetical protein
VTADYKRMGLIAGAVVVGIAALGGAYFMGQSGSKPAPEQPHTDAATTPATDPDKIGRMEIQAQYLGPLKDTVIQRLRDPVDGRICYLYLPAIVPHSQPTPMGFVQYGANNIGAISCTHP